VVLQRRSNYKMAQRPNKHNYNGGDGDELVVDGQ
jgi:hypothetical protein